MLVGVGVLLSMVGVSGCRCVPFSVVWGMLSTQVGVNECACVLIGVSGYWYIWLSECLCVHTRAECTCISVCESECAAYVYCRELWSNNASIFSYYQNQHCLF